MTQNNPQVPWTDAQWARVNQVVQEEAQRARVVATFLPLFGPLAPDTDFVRADVMSYPASEAGGQRMKIADTETVLLSTLQVKVFLRGAQMADPDMTSALQMFRRAANVLARLEDAIAFKGRTADGQLQGDAVAGLPGIWEMLGGQQSRGLLDESIEPIQVHQDPTKGYGDALVGKVSEAVGQLEGKGHFGPFALVLGHDFFTAVQTPNKDSLVLAQDRIVAFLGGGSLLRSSTLPPESGVLVALGAAPVELVVATDVSVNFLQVTLDPMYVFRVYEKMVLRIKEPDAIVALLPG